MDYLELKIDLSPREPWSEILIAQLADAGFESFQETPQGLLAYRPHSAVDLNALLEETVLHTHKHEIQFRVEENIIPQQNWNATWESDFHPVEVENLLAIVAPFHDQSSYTGHIIEIQPKMSFGTGHHQTTWMMSKAMFNLSLKELRVLDMGTGTGVLAILAEKLGASEVVAIDIEPWSAENTIENAERNGCSKIKTYCGDVDLIQNQKFGVILANINKNILKAHMKEYAEALEENGTLLLSGFFDSDVEEISAFCAALGLQRVETYFRDNWACIQLLKHK